jgi:DNA-binding NarL/FixJ family response regulator
MERSLQVFIVSGSPIMARALQQLLHESPLPHPCEIVMGADLWKRAGQAHPDVMLLAPQNWEELSHWLPSLRHSFTRAPWLLLAEPRLVGMFLPQLEGQPCAFVAPTASLEALWSALQGLIEEQRPSLRHELLAHFSRRGTPRDSVGRLRLPTSAELQCGCAVSLGLGNRQIAELLHLAEATVKSHVHNLLQKLELSNRTELGGFVRRAMNSLAAPAEWK